MAMKVWEVLTEVRHGEADFGDFHDLAVRK
jgi:hypothetical protein